MRGESQPNGLNNDGCGQAFFSISTPRGARAILKALDALPRLKRVGFGGD